jgi:branched-chain amino acid transport system substrate-binding protein
MRHTKRVLVACATLTLLLGACVDSSIKTGQSGDVTTTPNTPTAPQGPTTTTAGSSADTNWALGYTGGKAGQASGAPFTIGYANQESLFPEATIGLDAAVKFANAELGGIDGHPIVVQKCTINVEEDGQSCGTQFANNPNIKAVLTGTLLVGAQGLYGALNGKKPVLIGNGLTTTDFTTPAGYSFTTGAVGVVTGMAMYVADMYKPKPKKVAVMYGNNPSAQGAYQLLMLPVLKKAGINVAGVQVADPGGTAAQVQTAIQNVGADSADVFITLTTQPECIATYDAIQSLNIHPTVVTTGLCFGTPMTNHIQAAGEKGVMPDGWYFGDYGYHYFLPDVKSGMQTYIDKVRQYGVPAPGAKTLEYTGFAGPTFANVLTLVKFANAIGYAKISTPNLLQQIKSFKGPMMLQVGPIDCGHVSVAGQKLFVSLCATQMGILRYKNLKWSEIAGGVNGHPIDSAKANV